MPVKVEKKLMPRSLSAAVRSTCLINSLWQAKKVSTLNNNCWIAKLYSPEKKQIKPKSKHVALKMNDLEKTKTMKLCGHI